MFCNDVAHTSLQGTTMAQVRQWGYGQADLRICCLHMAKTGFLMTWLNSYQHNNNLKPVILNPHFILDICTQYFFCLVGNNGTDHNKYSCVFRENRCPPPPKLGYGGNIIHEAVTLKIRSRSPISNKLLILSYLYSLANLVPFHPMVHETRASARRG